MVDTAYPEVIEWSFPSPLWYKKNGQAKTPLPLPDICKFVMH